MAQFGIILVLAMENGLSEANDRLCNTRQEVCGIMRFMEVND